jgi:hypothetical protein
MLNMKLHRGWQNIKGIREIAADQLLDTDVDRQVDMFDRFDCPEQVNL